MLKQMEADEEARPCENSIMAVLDGCADIGALDFGQCLYGCVKKTSLGLNVAVNNAMMDMYSKSGRLDLAAKVFDEILMKDLYSWTLTISGCADLGEGHRALEVYSHMLESRVAPNEVSQLSLLTASSMLG